MFLWELRKLCIELLRKPVGLWEYGFADYVSYGYPIGLDLKIFNTN